MLSEKTVERDPTGSIEGAGEPRPHLFLVLECHRPSAGGARYSLRNVREIVFRRGAARAVSRETDGGALRLIVRVPDPLMSSTHARITRTPSAHPGGAGWALEDLGSTNGSYVGGQKTGRASIDDDSLIELGGTLFALRTVCTPADTVTDVESSALGGRAHGFATLVPGYARQLRALAQMALAHMPVLLLGESGTGKEVLAGGIHALSGRRGAFVPVNCGAIPESLVESQMFGHVKGAFSGALRDELGFVRASHGGTLFLDEIGDLPRTSQAALLRVLQEREVTPLGSTKSAKVDLRVVSATHHRVDTLNASEAFRSDLYARVAGYTHHLLPLRERKEDLGMLVAELVERLALGREARFTPAFARALYMHSWPLNVRELQHALSAAAVFAADGPLDLRHAPEGLRASRPPSRPSSRPPSPSSSAAPAATSTLPPARPLSEDDERLRRGLVEALEATRGNVSEIARSMGKTRMQVHRWMRRFGIDPEMHRK